jgi:hypothetical protein
MDSLTLVKPKTSYKNLIINSNPILLPSSDQTPVVKKCWNALQRCHAPKICTFFHSKCTNRRWKFQNIKADPKKGRDGLIYTKIGLSGEIIDAKTKTITYHVVYFYHLTKTAFYKKMIRNDDPIHQDSVLLKTIASELFSNLPAALFDQFQIIFDEEIEYMCDSKNVYNVILKNHI